MTFLRCLTTLVEWEEATVSEEGVGEGGRELALLCLFLYNEN